MDLTGNGDLVGVKKENIIKTISAHESTITDCKRECEEIPKKQCKYVNQTSRFRDGDIIKIFKAL